MTPKNTEELIDDPNGMSDELLGETEVLHAMAELYLIQGREMTRNPWKTKKKITFMNSII